MRQFLVLVLGVFLFSSVHGQESFEKKKVNVQIVPGIAVPVGVGPSRGD